MTKSVESTADSSHVDSPERDVLEFLPPALQSALRCAAAVVATRTQGSPADAVSNLEKTRQLLGLLEQVAALRGATRLRLHNGDSQDELVIQLLSDDDDVAANASGRVRDLLVEARRASRSRRRATRKAARGDAEERESARHEAKIDRIRAARDKARHQLARLEEQLALAQQQLDSANEGLMQAVSQLEAAQHRFHSYRTSLSEPRRAAQALLEALTGVNSQTTQQFDPIRTEERTSPQVLPELAVLQEASEALPPEFRDAALASFTSMLNSLARGPRISAVKELALRVDVLGGGDEIGGSCIMISAGGSRILVDCGARPSGQDEATMRPPHFARALEKPLDAVVITHAHHDHGGWVPALVAAQPGLRVISTPATADLLSTMWLDSAKVLARRVDSGDQWKGGAFPPFSVGDVHRALDRIEETAFGRTLEVGHLTVELFPAGHIVGAAGAVVSAGNERVVVTGDVSAPGQLTVGGWNFPPQPLGLTSCCWRARTPTVGTRLQGIRWFATSSERSREWSSGVGWPWFHRSLLGELKKSLSFAVNTSQR
jgi:glyoxylase-like metal-dependent hydrolase (beta-lactamase superfamily II)